MPSKKVGIDSRVETRGAPQGFSYGEGYETPLSIAHKVLAKAFHPQQTSPRCFLFTAVFQPQDPSASVASSTSAGCTPDHLADLVGFVLRCHLEVEELTDIVRRQVLNTGQVRGWPEDVRAPVRVLVLES